MRRPLLIATLAYCTQTTIAAPLPPDRVRLDNHEPNLVGITRDDDDRQLFLDFKVSLEYPIAAASLNDLVNQPHYPDSLRKICENQWIDKCYPYFAFTGRFGQYIGERHSSPVISKRFNPKIFFRISGGETTYLDLEYAHESNGQRITSLASYNALADDLANEPDGKREYANDYISRGWDYVGWTLKHRIPLGSDFRASFFLSHQNYIGGLLQGEIEEYNDWETPREITAREQVNGWRLLAKVDNKTFKLVENWAEHAKLALIMETGTRDTFDYNTYQVEFTTKLADMPVMLWWRNGYNSDLAQYFKKVESAGVAFELKTFD